MSNGLPLTPERKEAFLAELGRHGIVARAARAASPQTTKGAVSTFKDERQRDPGFAAAWEEALEIARGEVEHEIYRRSIEGIEEPIFGGKYKDTIVGTVRKYSDRLLELRARALLPAYRDAASLNVNKRVTHDVDAGLLGDAVTSVALRLANTFRPPMKVIDGGVTDDA